MKIPFIKAMAEQEERTKGKYTGVHWRNEYKKWLSEICKKIVKDN